MRALPQEITVLRRIPMKYQRRGFQPVVVGACRSTQSARIIGSGIIYLFFMSDKVDCRRPATAGAGPLIQTSGKDEPMIKLNADDLVVHSYATGPGDPIEPGDNTTTGTNPELTATDPRACPLTQGWNCYTTVTNAPGCESSPGYNC
jgi:hypothetical protein